MTAPYKAALAQSWLDNAAGWTAAVREDRIESRRLSTNEAIIEMVLASAPRRVLDMGCGEGWLVRKLNAQGIEAVGVEGSLPLVRAARAAGGHFLHLSYDEVSANPATAGGIYDAVIFNFALLEQELAPLLRAVKALLSKRGHLIIQTVHPWTACGEAAYADGWRSESFDQFGSAFPTPMPWYFRTLASWMAILKECGYLLADLREPRHPENGKPLSLLLICEAAISST